MFRIVPFRDRHEQLHRVFSRDSVFSEDVAEAVRRILNQVRTGGDRAVLELTQQFDGVRSEALSVSRDRIQAAYDGLKAELRDVIVEATGNIQTFHKKQVRQSWFSEEDDGVVLGQRYVPLDRVGVYVPGGTAAYPSSVLMNVIPAQIAGVQEIYLASPPTAGGSPHPLVLAAAHLLGIENVFAVGGAQAVGAFAYGTDTVPRVDKIVGPGNAYVAAAKKQVYGTVDIDSIAGPSEIVVLADSGASPDYVAADLLSQAEHDERASAVLVTTDAKLAERVKARVEALSDDLPRREIVRRALEEFGGCVVADSVVDAIGVVNELAPEHLELLVEEPGAYLPQIRHAGAIFLGPYSPEPVGDYFAGPNHILPTGGTARYASALGVEDFVRRQSVIAYTKERLERTGSRIATFARAEELEAHARAVEARLASDDGKSTSRDSRAEASESRQELEEEKK